MRDTVQACQSVGCPCCARRERELLSVVNSFSSAVTDLSRQLQYAEALIQLLLAGQESRASSPNATISPPQAMSALQACYYRPSEDPIGHTQPSNNFRAQDASHQQLTPCGNIPHPTPSVQPQQDMPGSPHSGVNQGASDLSAAKPNSHQSVTEMLIRMQSIGHQPQPELLKPEFDIWCCHDPSAPPLPSSTLPCQHQPPTEEEPDSSQLTDSIDSNQWCSTSLQQLERNHNRFRSLPVVTMESFRDAGSRLGIPITLSYFVKAGPGVAHSCGGYLRKLVCLSDAFMQEIGATDMARCMAGIERVSLHNPTARASLAAFAKHLLLSDDLVPCMFRAMFYRDKEPSQIACMWVYPCVYYDGSKHHTLGKVLFADVRPQRVAEVLMLDHLALKYAPCIINVVDDRGRIITQNAASLSALGFQGSDHRDPAARGERWDYLRELLWEESEYSTMQRRTAAGQEYKAVVEVRSDRLRRWLTAGDPGASGPLWHEVQVSKLRDPFSHQALYVVSQTDMSAAVAAQAKVAELQRLQQKLLQEILPQQVIDVMLNRQGSVDGRPRVAQAAASSSTQRPCTAAGAAGAACTACGSPGAAVALLPHPAAPTPDGRMLLPSPSMCQDSSDGEDMVEGQLSRWDVVSLATYHEEVSVLFSDIIGFTAMCQQLHPAQVMLFLDSLFSQLDQICEKCNVYKVETIGDCFMVCGGLFACHTTTSTANGSPADESSNNQLGTCNHMALGGKDPLHAQKVFSFARALLQVVSRMASPLGGPLQMRVGIHSGPVMSGVVGRKMPRFCLFGDTVNTASRMETTCEPGRIHVSEATRNLLPSEPWRSTGGVMAKGKGMIQTYMWEGEG